MAKQYSPRLKFQIAMEVLRDNKKPSQVAKAYGIHPNSVSKWTKGGARNAVSAARGRTGVG